ncbi:MAG: hypothetical protein QOC61_2225 [Acidobacteriota bacterium]|nr:hypothetical protein [Acidobacteriota bacterium]
MNFTAEALWTQRLAEGSKSLRILRVLSASAVNHAAALTQVVSDIGPKKRPGRNQLYPVVFSIGERQLLPASGGAASS